MADRGPARNYAEFELGSLWVCPRERMIESEDRSVTLEPLVMQLLVALSRRAGMLLTREEIFEICWGSAAVGDDSLNRVVAVLRKAIQQTGATSVTIETVAGAGYVLRVASDNRHETGTAIDAAYNSWRLGLPEPDHLRLELMRHAVALDPGNARAWGLLALLCRHAAEYCAPDETTAFVSECENAARTAITLASDQPEALTALVGVEPLFGNWAEKRRRLTMIVESNPDCAPAIQELATLEMSTGRILEGKRLRDLLIARDPLGAAYCYKSVYQHWAIGDLVGMDHAADRAIALWPSHPAVWMVRLWTLAYTDRVPAALSMVEDTVARPYMPARALSFFRTLLAALATKDEARLAHAAAASVDLAQTGPANAVAAMFALGLLGRRDEQYAVAEAYFYRAGDGPVPLRHTDAELSLNEQHRRLTQVLFMPVFASTRGDARFRAICDRVGLQRYWDESGLTPDFLASELPI